MSNGREAIIRRSRGPLPLWTLKEHEVPNICEKCREPWPCRFFKELTEAG